MSNSAYTGVVKWYRIDMRYGFITRTDTKSDVFVHKSKIVARYRYQLRRDDTVTFTLKTTRKGPEAYQVTKADPQTGRNGTKKEESCRLTYPYFKQPVPEDLIDKSNQDPLYPTEWVGWQTWSQIVFVQVAYPILPDDFESYEKINDTKLLSYKVFEGEDDFNGKKIARTSLVKLLNKKSEAKGLVAAGGKFTQSWPNFSFEQSKKSETIGWIWMEQVETDFQILQHLQHSCEDCDKDFKWFATACFLAQQVAEKALTGGICFFSGSDVDIFDRFKHHGLFERIKALQPSISQVNFKMLELEANKVHDHYLKTRHPNQWKNYEVPANEYKEDDATTAIASAKKIKETVKASMDKKEKKALDYVVAIAPMKRV